MRKHILAIDQGTTSSRALVFDAQFQIVGMAEFDFQQFFPHSGWVEHDPDEIWRGVVRCCRESVAKAGLTFHDIDAIGITNQRETTVQWDRQTGEVIHPAIVWQDRRTSEYCRSLRESISAHTIQQKTGLLLDPYFSATKIHWLLHNVPDAMQRAQGGELAFGTIDAFLLWRLTGGRVHATDASNAARTLLFNLEQQGWDQTLLDLFDIPRAILPEVYDNTAQFGVVDAAIFGVEIPITAMVGDQQGALVGQECLRPGMLKSTYGTGCFVVLNTGDQVVHSDHQLLSTVGYRHQTPTFALEGSIFSAGVIVKWMRDQLHLFQHPADTERMAQAIPDTDGVYLVPAFTGLGAPYWDPDARAAFYGMSRGTTSAHLVRAGLESIVYQTYDLLLAMSADGAHAVTELRVDGKMAENSWLMQYLADIIQVPVVRPQSLETTALGAAFLAAVGRGHLTLIDISDYWTQAAQFVPQCSQTVRDARYAGWQDAVHRTLTSPS